MSRTGTGNRDREPGQGTEATPNFHAETRNIHFLFANRTNQNVILFFTLYFSGGKKGADEASSDSDSDSSDSDLQDSSSDSDSDTDSDSPGSSSSDPDYSSAESLGSCKNVV